MSSVIYQLPSDRVLILDTRSQFLQPFQAINWTDLRLSMMLSLTSQAAPDQQTGLTETIGTGQDNNQVYLGFKGADSNLPPSSNFFGYSSQYGTPNSEQTFLQGAPYDWTRATQVPQAYISNGTSKQDNHLTGAQLNFPAVNQPNPATLAIVQMLRNDPTLPVIYQANLYLVPPGTFYTDTSIGNLRALTAAAGNVLNCFGNFTFTAAPNAIYFYWPFMNSRLRIHSYVLEKYS